MVNKEAMKLALEVFNVIAISDNIDWIRHQAEQQATALREALAEQPAQQDPVAEVVEDDFSRQVVGIGQWHRLPNGTKLYTSPPAQRKPLTADELKEPKSGNQWHVVWWNESCRMMLPFDAKLDRFRSYKNGTLQFTIKKAAHGIKENT